MRSPTDDARADVRRSPRRRRASAPLRGNRKVLMIGNASPSEGGSGRLRSAEFAKHLRQFGWLPTVWTSNEVPNLPLDPTRGEKQTSHAVLFPRNAGSGILAMRRLLRGFVNARAGEGLTAVASRFSRAGEWRLEASHSATALVDDYIPWARRSVESLIGHVRAERYNVIYSTISFASSHRLALELKRRTILPWVADLRDLWTDERSYRERSLQRRAAHRQLEQEVLEGADIVIAASELQRRSLADQIPAKYDRIITITDGSVSADHGGAGDADSEGALQLNGLGSDDPGPDCCFELARQLVVVFDRLADQAAKADETVHASLTTCP